MPCSDLPCDQYPEVEKYRIGNALSKEEKLRNYIKDHYGSLINYLVSEEGLLWFDVTAGLNGYRKSPDAQAEADIKSPLTKGCELVGDLRCYFISIKERAQEGDPHPLNRRSERAFPGPCQGRGGPAVGKPTNAGH